MYSMLIFIVSCIIVLHVITTLFVTMILPSDTP